MSGNILPVILSGGSGSRLWPLSRKQHPKQFLKLTAKESLFQETVKRISRFQKPIIVGNEEHRFIIAEQLREVDINVSSLILEPTPKDTAPAMALAALEAISANHKDDVMLVLPADQIIEDEEAFMESVEAGFSLVNDGKIVVFGSTPSAPKSSYSYIEMGSDIDGYGHIVDSFTEKPNIEKAEEFCNAGNFLWSTGMFMFTPAQYMEALEIYEPEIARRCRVAHVERRVDNDFVRPGADAFEASPEYSLTYIITEMVKNVAVVPLMTKWNDIGGWGDLWKVLQKDENGNCVKGNVTIENTKNSFIHSEHGMLAVMGLEDIVVVQTEDATLVIDKKKACLVKKVFEHLRDVEQSKFASHQCSYLAWGNITLIQEDDNKHYKTIVVNSKCSTDAVKYYQRLSHWVVTKGSGILHLDGTKQVITEGESICLKAGISYKLENMQNSPLEIVEISIGDMSEKCIFINDITEQLSITPSAKVSAKPFYRQSTIEA